MEMGRISLKLLPYFIILQIIILSACSNDSVNPSPLPSYEYQMPEETGDGWETATPADVGLDEDILCSAVTAILRSEYRNIHSFLIVKDDRLVFEAYFDGYDYQYSAPRHHGALVHWNKDTPHNMHSVTKSVTSILFGIALDQGYISNVDETMFSYFPQYADIRNAKNETITLEHLLTMTSGLQWNEENVPLESSKNDLIQMAWSLDPIAYILSKPVIATPGYTYYYSGGNTNLIGEVIREATGLRMDTFSKQYLFDPLGISQYEWSYFRNGVVYASGDIFLRPRDMAKLGYLYLNGGMWQGQRIASEGWISESTYEHVTFSPPSDYSGYGYQWWIKTFTPDSQSVDVFFASGWGGQRIFVIPDMDMVVVFTGANYMTYEPPEEIISRFVLPAVSDNS